MTKLSPPTRQILSQVFKNHDSLKAFENLFTIAGELTPDELVSLAVEIAESKQDAQAASNKAEAAYSLVLKRIDDMLLPIKTLDHSQEIAEIKEKIDTIPPVIPHEEIVGGSGSFTTSDGKTVTVENGIIKTII